MLSLHHHNIMLVSFGHCHHNPRIIFSGLFLVFCCLPGLWENQIKSYHHHHISSLSSSSRACSCYLVTIPGEKMSATALTTLLFLLLIIIQKQCSMGVQRHQLTEWKQSESVTVGLTNWQTGVGDAKNAIASKKGHAMWILFNWPPFTRPA